MQFRRSQGRGLFLAYLCASYAAILAAAPLLSSAGSASTGASHRPLPTFEQADRNHDGAVSRFESRAVRALLEPEQFRDADLDGDGRIDAAEYQRIISKEVR
jgi:hypothetical protein